MRIFANRFSRPTFYHTVTININAITHNANIPTKTHKPFPDHHDHPDRTRCQFLWTTARCGRRWRTRAAPTSTKPSSRTLSRKFRAPTTSAPLSSTCRSSTDASHGLGRRRRDDPHSRLPQTARTRTLLATRREFNSSYTTFARFQEQCEIFVIEVTMYSWWI